MKNHAFWQFWFTRNIYKVYWSAWFRIKGYGLCFEHVHADHPESIKIRYGTNRKIHSVGNVRFWVLLP